MPSFNEEEVEKIIFDRINNAPNIKREEILSGIVNKKVSETIIKEVKDNSIKALAKELKNFTLNVMGNLGFDYSQVTRGGIETFDIDEKTLIKRYKAKEGITEELSEDQKQLLMKD